MQPELSCCCGGRLDHCRYSAHFDCPVDCRHVTFLLLFWRFSDVHCQNCDALYANEHQYNNNIVIINQTIKICKSKLGLWQIKTLVYNAILDLQTHDGQILTAPIAQRCNATSQSLKACIVHVMQRVWVGGWVRGWCWCLPLHYKIACLTPAKIFTLNVKLHCTMNPNNPLFPTSPRRHLQLL